MKKRIVSTLLCTAMAASLFAGCGSAASTSTSASGSSSSASSAAKEESTSSASSEAADESAETEATSDTASAGGQTIGISMPTKSLERWNRDGSYLQDQFEKAGYKVELTYSDNKSAQQNNDIEGLIADKVDLLVVAAIDGEALSQVLN